MKNDDCDYRCKKCGVIVIPHSHHKMARCACGAMMVDRGWYGSRVLFNGKFDEMVEMVPRESKR